MPNPLPYDEVEAYKQNCMVYFHRNPITEQIFYVGMGTGRRPKVISKRNIRWKRYVAKYGKPIIEIYKTNLSPIDATHLETHFINYYGIKGQDDDGILYNLKIGNEGMNRYKHTDESKAKISKAFKGEGSVNWGRKATEEARKNQSLAKKGSKWTGKQRQAYFDKYGRWAKQARKEGERVKGGKYILPRRNGRCYPSPHFTFFKYTPNGMRAVIKNNSGFTHSEEFKKKIGLIHKGKIVSIETRKKMSETRKRLKLRSKKVIHNESGLVFNSIWEAAIHAGVQMKTLSTRLRGKLASKELTTEYSYYNE